MDYAKLRAELQNARYASMTDAEAAADLMTPRITRERTSLTSAEIYEALDPQEYQALADVTKSYVRDILSLGTGIDVSAGSNARLVMTTIFPPGTQTLANLAALIQETVSRADELGLGTVYEGHVTKARAL